MKPGPRHDFPGHPPTISRWWVRWFSVYGERYVRRHFHSLRLCQSAPPVPSNPLVIYLNHASWWDPMICVVLRNRFFRHRECYAPIDAAALEKYPFFRKLGFFPVEQQARRGTVAFLEGSAAALARSQSLLWVTPHGRFVDVRDDDAGFRPGLAHLAARVQVATYLPLALEYVFWEERLPEACINFGEPLVVTREQAEQAGPRQLTALFEEKLRLAQQQLAGAVIQRDSSQLRVLDRQSVGVGGVYDAWRRCRALLRGRAFDPGHGAK